MAFTAASSTPKNPCGVIAKQGPFDCGGSLFVNRILCLAGDLVSAASTAPTAEAGLHWQPSDLCATSSAGTLIAESVASKTVLPHNLGTSVDCVEVSTMPLARRWFACLVLSVEGIALMSGMRAGTAPARPGTEPGAPP